MRDAYGAKRPLGRVTRSAAPPGWRGKWWGRQEGGGWGIVGHVSIMEGYREVEESLGVCGC